MEPQIPFDAILKLLGINSENLKAVEDRLNKNPSNSLIGANAAMAFGNPRTKEASSFYLNRYPQILNALTQPGIRNKFNGLSAAAANEGTNWLGDLLINEGLPYAAGIIGAKHGGPQAGTASYAATKTVAPFVSLVKDSLQSDYVDPKVYEKMDKVNFAQHLPSIDNISGLLTNNSVSRGVMNAAGRLAVDNVDKNITGWATDQQQKHPTPTIVEPLRQKLTSDIPKGLGNKSAARQVIKPMYDAINGKKPWKNAFKQAVMGALYPDEMTNAENLQKHLKSNLYGRTALGNK